MEIDVKFLENHKEKCRLCFSSFKTSFIKITDLIATQFFELTQLQLKSLPKLSENICRNCCDELEKFSNYKKDLFLKQQKLYDFLDADIKEELEETCIIIKTEKEVRDVCQVQLTELIKQETSHSDSSADPFDDFFISDKNRRRKIKKIKSKSEKKSIIWHHCPHCDKKFYTEVTLQIHIDSIHFNLKNFQCEKCDFRTHTPFLLKGHVARVHDRTKVVPSSKNQPKTSCPICGLLVQKVSSHIRNVHTRPKNVFCDICGFGIFNLNRLRRHMFKHLSKETKQFLVSYFCDICGAVLHSKNSIKSHMRNIHLQTGEREHKCFCGRSYKAESYLKVHQKTHEKTAKHLCSQCDKKFMSQSQLKIHMEIHERKGRKDYSCEICGGMYGSINLLMRHKIFHTEPNHACQYCGKKFHRPCLVDRHVKRQHEVEEAPCQFCGKMLNTLSMTRHVKEFHSGLPRLNCPIPGCNGTYLRRFHLKDHIQRSHKDFISSLGSDEKIALEDQISQMNLI